MFKIIEPNYHCFYKSLIDRFMDLTRSCSSLGLSQKDQNAATFILNDDRETGVYGGALLLKKKLNDFPPELVKTLADFISPQESMWRCIISLSVEKESPLYDTDEIMHFYQIFYRKLYNRLVGFGKKEETGFLCVSLDSGEYLCMEGLIVWPYVFEIKPQDSSDGLFHGILPLIGSPYEDYQRSWQDFELPSHERKIVLGVEARSKRYKI
ncbi:MAG TPA: hypothetical protein VMW10_07075 [Alphaproteobacteria bacterium]|nr:hypothetical protein [Alphaproteobacteria bacterium]